MTKLLWDQPGHLKYESGIDRTVLYLGNRQGVAWNGVKSLVEEFSDSEMTPMYFDGLKYFDTQGIDGFGATLAAFTYPDEFLPYDGLGQLATGVFADLQDTTTFHLSYRNKIANEETGDLGYKLHLLYNLVATPTSQTYTTGGKELDPMDFSWTLNSIPETVNGYWPSSHVCFDSTILPAPFMSDLEDMLYGTSTSNSYLPSLSALISFVSTWALIRVADNGDGTATISGSTDNIKNLNDGTYLIISPDITRIDADTVMINTTYG